MNLWWLFAVISCLQVAVSAGLPGGLNSVLKGVRRMLGSGGGGRRGHRRTTEISRTFFPTTTVSTMLVRATPAALATTLRPVPVEEYQEDNSVNSGNKLLNSISTEGNKLFGGISADDLLGSLAISFANPDKDDQTTGDNSDVISRFTGMLPMIESVAKPIMRNYKGTDGYSGFLKMLQEAKELFSNREVIRQVNQLLDQLISGNDSQTPPTPSDSSLTSLAQIAQNMESLFNVPQNSRARSVKRRNGKDTALATNKIPVTEIDDEKLAYRIREDS